MLDQGAERFFVGRRERQDLAIRIRRALGVFNRAPQYARGLQPGARFLIARACRLGRANEHRHDVFPSVTRTKAQCILTGSGHVRRIGG